MTMDPSPLEITPQIADIVTGAVDSGNIMLLAAVDADGKPILSFRGSTAVFSGTQLSLWARNSNGGTVEAIGRNPHVALIYRSKDVPVLQFSGRASITGDAAERDRVYDLMPEQERQSVPDRQGRAIIVDLDEIKGILGFDGNGPVFCHMTRDR